LAGKRSLVHSSLSLNLTDILPLCVRARVHALAAIIGTDCGATL